MVKDATRAVLEIGAAQLEYVESGSGEAVLCLHGEAPSSFRDALR